MILARFLNTSLIKQFEILIFNHLINATNDGPFNFEDQYDDARCITVTKIMMITSLDYFLPNSSSLIRIIISRDKNNFYINTLRSKGKRVVKEEHIYIHHWTTPNKC